MDKQTGIQRYETTSKLVTDTQITLDNSVFPKAPPVIHELGKLLLLAAADGNVDEVKKLLSKGAPFTADWLGTSPLHLAAQNNHLYVVSVLLKAGMSKDARTKVDRTPLHLAAYEGHLAIVEALVLHGADIDCRDLLGMTPLHWAVQNGHLEIVEYLIKFGADVTVMNKFDLTPGMIAKQTNRGDIENLIENGFIDSEVATQNLVLQLGTEDGGETVQILNGNIKMEEPLVIPLEPEIINQLQQRESEVPQIEDCNEFVETEGSLGSVTNDNSIQNATNLTNSLKLLEEHGITMLENENDDTNILNTVMESGHSVVLTDVGKEVLNSVKEQEYKLQSKDKKILTVSPEEFFAMANQTVVKNHTKSLKFRRILVKKNNNKAQKIEELGNSQNLETVMSELLEARRTIQELRTKLKNKEEEAEKYKMQLNLLMDSS